MNQKLLTGLIVLVAVVVIAESLVIITRLTPGKTLTLAPVSSTTPSIVLSPQTNTDTQFSLTSATAAHWTKGTPATVTVSLSANHPLSVDALDLYLKYDPAKLTVTKLGFSDLKPTLNKISPTSGLVVANYLIADQAGFKLTTGQSLQLMTLSVTPKVAGAIQLEVATGQTSSGSTTMIIENETSKSLTFSASPLTVNVQ